MKKQEETRKLGLTDAWDQWNSAEAALLASVNKLPNPLSS